MLCVCALSLLLFSSPAHAQDGANPFIVLEQCVIQAATRLEASKEAADIVAEAAVASCGNELTAATPSGGPLRSNVSARMQVKDTMRETALLHVVELRAKRNAPPPPAPPKKKSRR